MTRVVRVRMGEHGRRALVLSEGLSPMSLDLRSMVATQWCLNDGSCYPDAPREVYADMTLRFRRLHPDARLPTRGHAHDAGLDLFMLPTLDLDDDWLDGPGGTCTVRCRTGLAVEIPEGHVGLICGRSGLGARGIDVHGSVVDAGYRGEVAVILQLHAAIPLDPSRAVAQLLIVPIATPTPEWAEELSPTPRGARGFGSTDAEGPAS